MPSRNVSAAILLSRNYVCRSTFSSSKGLVASNLFAPTAPRISGLANNFASLAYQHPIQASQQKSLNLAEVTFDDGKLAFGSIGSKELLKHALLLTVLRIPGLSANSSSLLNLSNKIIGKKATTAVIRATLFSHFCGGEDLDGLMKTSKRLNKMGIGAIVDYAAESDDSCGSDGVGQDAWLDENVELTENAISCAARMKEASGSSGFSFVAVKVTAVSDPLLLRKLTTVLNLVHHSFGVSCGHLKFDGRPSLVDPRGHDVLITKSVGLQQFTSTMKSLWPELTDAKIVSMFETALNLKGSITPNEVSFVQWTKFFSPEVLASLPAPVIPSSSADTATLKSSWLTESDATAIAKVTLRMDRISTFARGPEIRLLIDAEQTFFQTAIDYFAFQQQEKCNIPTTDSSDLKSTPAIIYNTYQMYLKGTMGRLVADAKRAELLGYKNALKMVRGAYMFQERRVAEEYNYESPVNDTLEDTHRSYNGGVEFMINRLDNSELLCGKFHLFSLSTISFSRNPQ